MKKLSWTFAAVLFSTLPLVFGGCYGTIGLASALGSSSSSGGSNQGAVVSDVEVGFAETSPALIQFRLTDVDSTPADVTILFALHGQDPCPPDVPAGEIPVLLQRGKNPCGGELIEVTLTDLLTSPGGVLHKKLWDFAADGQLETVRFSPCVDLEIRVVRDGSILTSAAVRTGVGNDPPSIPQLGVSLGETDEVMGIANLDLIVQDSSQDRVALIAEYLLLDEPGASFRAATTAGGVPPDEIPASSTGRAANFFWDVVADIGLTEHEVQFRIIPDDKTVQGNAATVSFRVDNNSPPQLSIDGGNFILNDDARRGIPLAFRVADGIDGGVGDDVRLVVQFARDPMSFPPLTTGDEDLTSEAIEQLLNDPVRRKEAQIATELPRVFQGKVALSSASDRVRLPELSGSASPLVEKVTTNPDGSRSFLRVRGVLDLLRPSFVPSPILATWSPGNSVQAPVSALPIENGLKALVLEATPEGWRIRSLELATGVEDGVIKTGEGVPQTMTLEQGGGALLLAVEVGPGPSFQIVRVTLPFSASSKIQTLITSDGGAGSPVRGIASLGVEAAVLTAGDALVRLDYPGSLPANLTVLLGPGTLPPSGLRSPWGIALDPLSPGSIFVSENGGDRVLTIHLESLEVNEVRAALPTRGGGRAFSNPESLALERSGTRLLVVTDRVEGDSRREVVGLDLEEGAREVFDVFPVSGEPGYSGSIGDLSTGPSGLRLVALTTQNDLGVGGGVEQTHDLMGAEGTYDSLRQEIVLVDSPEPEIRPGQPWRIQKEIGLVPARRQGTSGVFLWDSSDLLEGGDAFLKATPLDRDPGVEEVAGARLVRADQDVDPVLLPTNVPAMPAQFYRHVAAGDLDADGDLDLVAVSDLVQDDLITVFEQIGPLTFSSNLRTLGSASIRSPEFVVIADLYGDDRKLDFVVANSASSELVVLQQTDPLEFTQRQILGGPGITTSVRCVQVADVDRDGDLDLVSANPDQGSLAIFHKDGSEFGMVPTLIDVAELGSPAFVVVADLNRDGLPDLASADQLNHALVVLFQQTDGEFDGIPLVLTLPDQARPLALVAADLSGDGVLDLACANENAENVTVFFQKDPGVFDASAPLVLGGPMVTGGPRFLTAADLDGDGDLDLVTANSALSPVGNSLSTFFQTLPGEFEAGARLSSERVIAPKSVVASDIDFDGAVDLIATYDSNFGQIQGRVGIFRQERTARLGFKKVDLGDTTLTPNVRFAAASDLDGDGDFDLVTASRTTNELTLFEQIAPRRFLPEQTRLSTGFRPNTISLSDLDGDGDVDIACSNEGDRFKGIDGSLSVFFQSGPGVFDEVTLVLSGPEAGCQFFPEFVSSADVDGDGLLDLVATSQGSMTKGCSSPRDRVTVFLQDESSRFERDPILLEKGLAAPMGVAGADVNGDGLLDLVVANEGTDEIVLFFQNRGGGFTNQSLDLPIGTVPRRVAVADLDGNGRLDILTSNLSSAAVFLQRDDETFDLTTHRLVGNQFFDVDSGDVDDDGDLDLICATEDPDRDGEVLLFLQQSPGEFVRTPRILATSTMKRQRLRSIQVLDLDGDGDLDILTANSTSDDVSIFYQ